MRTNWRTLWVGHDIVVVRGETEVDRLPGDRIARVILVYGGQGDLPGDVVHTLVELAGDDGFALLEPQTGFADRVNFERQAFWRERRCVYWVAASAAVLPWRVRAAAWRGDAGARAFRRVSREALADAVERWPLGQPQTWEERKLRRIERSRPFGMAYGAHA